jgi:DNA primase catalytic subunit
LVKGKTLTKPLEYFFCAAILAFEYVFKNRKNPRNLALLSDHYLDFLSVIFWCIENKKEVTVALMNDQELHRELRATNWEEYSVEIVQNYPEMLEKFAPRYAKIKKSLDFKEEDEVEEKEEEN